MKNKQVYGYVAAGHMVLAAFVMQGCQTVGRSSIGGGSGTTGTYTPPTTTTTGTGPTVVVEPTPIRQPVSVKEVGKPGTFITTVIPPDHKDSLIENGITRTSRPHTSLPPPTIIPVKETPETVTVSGDTIAYTVKSGDTFSKIANSHGFKTAELASLNGISDPNKIRVGQTIKIPKGRKPLASGTASAANVSTANGKIHTVASGESLSTIAQQHNVKTADLAKANSITDVNKIRVGQKLVIPGTASTAPTPTQPGNTAVTINRTTTNTGRTAVVPLTPTSTTTTRPPVRPDPTNVVTPNASDTLIDVLMNPNSTMEGAKTLVQDKKDDVVTTVEQIKTTVTTQIEDRKIATHTVQEGEDLYSIAIKYNARPGEIRKYNELSGNTVLKPGQSLKIPLVD